MQEQSTPSMRDDSSSIRFLLWIVLSINFLLAIGFSLLEIYGIRRDLLWNADFSVYYSEGLMIREGHGSRIYDTELEKEYQQRVMNGRSFAGGILPFVYPPHVSLIFVPFSLFSRQVAMALWITGQLLLLLYFLRMLRRIISMHSGFEQLLISTAILAYLPMFITIWIGAFSLIMLVCHMKIYLCLREGKEDQAGLWFSAGMIKPQHLILPGLVLLAARRWRAIAIAVLVGIVLFLISSLILGWHIWPTYVQLASTLTDYFDKFGFSPHKMYNFRGILSVLLGYGQGNLINAISKLALVSSALVTFWIWRRPYEPQKPEFTLRMAFTLLMGSFFNLHFYPQDALLLVGPAVLFYDYLGQRGLSRKVFAAFALSFPTIFLVLWFITRRNQSQFVPIPVLAMIALGIWIGIALHKEYQVDTKMVA
jgi:hypothetical protein